MQTEPTSSTYNGLPKRWVDRFEFFDAHGAPGSPAYKAAFKQIPFLQRIKIGGNFFAFFFGPIYFLVCGLWRTAIATLGLTCAACVIAAVLMMFVPGDRAADMIARMAGLAVALICAQVANYAVYRKEVKREAERWNFFKLIRWI